MFRFDSSALNDVPRFNQITAPMSRIDAIPPALQSRDMTEAEVRALRDRVYDHVISDIGWSAVRKNWLCQSETAFLVEHDFPLATPHSQEYILEHPPRTSR